MSIVRYTNKKTGSVALYESTSHYDPVTKTSRPIRKYLGIEDPVTGELIPSSGQRGRKKGTGSPAITRSNNNNQEEDYRFKYEEAKKECVALREQIKNLEHKNKLLISNLERLNSSISGMLAMVNTDSAE